MCSVDLSTRECGGRVVVVLRGGLDVTDAANVAAALAVVAAREREIIVDLADLEYIDSSGVAALARVRKQVRHAGGDLLLAAPQLQVLRLLALTRLIDVFSVHASVEQAADAAECSRRVTAPVAGRPVIRCDMISRGSSMSRSETRHARYRRLSRLRCRAHPGRLSLPLSPGRPHAAGPKRAFLPCAFILCLARQHGEQVTLTEHWGQE